jgi:hypothetical protein
MAKIYHKFLSDIYHLLIISLKAEPHYENAWSAMAGALDTKRVDVYPEYHLGTVGGNLSRTETYGVGCPRG